MNTLKQLCLILLVPFGVVIFADDVWITEPADSPLVKPVTTAFGEGWKITAEKRTNVILKKKLNAEDFAGKNVILDGKFKFTIAKTGAALVGMEYKDAAGKLVRVELRRHYYCGTETLPWVRYIKAVKLPDKISDLNLVAALSNTNGELTVCGLRLIPDKPEKELPIELPKRWRSKLTSCFYSDNVHAYSRFDKRIFRMDILDDTLFVPNASQQQNGFVPFCPAEVREVAPGRRIHRDEVLQSLNIRSTPGQGQECFLAIGALRTLKDVTVEVTDLKRSDGKVLEACIFDVRQAELMNIITGRDYYRVIPKVQIPVGKCTVSPDCPKLYNLISHLPDDAEAGIYKGEVLIHASGKTQRLPLTFQVLPFKLVKGKPYMFCYYHKPDLQAFEKMKEYGANTVYLGSAGASVYYKDGELVLDMSQCDELVKCYRQVGFTERMIFNPFHDRLAMRVLELCGLQKNYKVIEAYHEPLYIFPKGEYPKKAEDLYKVVLKRVIDHTRKANYPEYYLHLVDEPDEMIDRPVEERSQWAFRGYVAKMEFTFSKEIEPSVKIFSTAYRLPTIDNLRPQLDVGCAEIGRISRADAIKYRETVHSWGQPFWCAEWPAWWDDVVGTRIHCGFIPADRQCEGFIIWPFYSPDPFDPASPEFEVADFEHGYQRTMYCYRDTSGKYCPTVAFEGIRAGSNDWRFVETLREIIRKLPEEKQKSVTDDLEKVTMDDAKTADVKRNYVINKTLELLSEAKE